MKSVIILIMLCTGMIIGLDGCESAMQDTDKPVGTAVSGLESTEETQSEGFHENETLDAEIITESESVFQEQANEEESEIDHGDLLLDDDGNLIYSSVGIETTITLDEYNLIENGMDYYDVSDIVGAIGGITGQSDSYIEYTFIGAGGASAVITFEKTDDGDELVVDKYQDGLD